MRGRICVLAIVGAALTMAGGGTAARSGVIMTAAPARATAATTATFRWKAEPGTRTVCRVTHADAPTAAVRSRRAELFKPCTSPARWTGLAPGRHAFVLLAVRRAHIAGHVVYRWTIGSSAVSPGTGTSPTTGGSPAPPSPPSPPPAGPPAPPGPPPPPPPPNTLRVTFTSGPSSSTTSLQATFAWTLTNTTNVPATVSCSLDGTAYEACSSPKTVSVAVGSHTFAVRAATYTSATTSVYSWNVTASGGGGGGGSGGSSCGASPYKFLAPQHPEISAAEQQFVDLVNQARAGLGLAALQVNSQLNIAADSHSYWQDVALGNGLSHSGCGGSDPGQRIADAGYRAMGWGEVTLISNPPASAQTAFTMFKNSPGHWAILTSSSLKEIGVGASSYHWTGDLGTQ